MIAAGTLAALALAQPMQARSGAIDPFLWPSVRPAVEEAAAAERDPKRGPGNAVELLRREKRRHRGAAPRVALDLRIAATMIRQRALSSERFSPAVRRAQALSTYSRLDLAEPGLPEALHEALRLSSSNTSTSALHLQVAFLGRTPGLDIEPMRSALASHMSALGIRLEAVEPDEARFLVKLGAQDGEPQEGRRVVTVRLDIEEREHGEVVWRRAMYRSSSAPTAEAALEASLDWVTRIGGRDLLFHYLADGPLPELKALASERADPHGHHHHR